MSTAGSWRHYNSPLHVDEAPHMPDIKFQCPSGQAADGYHASSQSAERGVVVGVLMLERILLRLRSSQTVIPLLPVGGPLEGSARRARRGQAPSGFPRRAPAPFRSLGPRDRRGDAA